MEKTKKPLNVWQLSTFVFALLSIILGGILIEEKTGGLKPEEAAKKAIEYVNKNLLQEGSTATFVKIDDKMIKELYKFTLSVGGKEYPSYVSKDGKDFFASDSINISGEKSSDTNSNNGPEMTQKESTEIDGGFKEIKDVEVCKENDKPIVYFFGSESCPHCTWEHPLISEVAQSFGDSIVYKERIDSQDDMDVFNKYSSGSIPMLVIGCKYYRGGSGEGYGEEKEKEYLKSVICKATGNQPSICQ
jgi:thiol-disulfide isomerase/thioredoxin